MKSYPYFATSFIIALSLFITCSNSQQLLLKRLQDSFKNKELKENERISFTENLKQDPICDCGEHSIECYYANGEKNCTCKEGYAQSVDGKCEECQCGTGELRCSFYSTGYRKCTCKKGYAVTIETSEKNQTCERCDCGPHTLACVLDAKENQMCTCEDKYAVKSNETGAKVCERCNCGFHTKSCVFNSKGYRQCTCDNGYLVTSQYNWGGDQECTTTDATGWKIATGVISVLCAIITVLLLMSLYRNSQR